MHRPPLALDCQPAGCSGAHQAPLRLINRPPRQIRSPCVFASSDIPTSRGSYGRGGSGGPGQGSSIILPGQGGGAGNFGNGSRNADAGPRRIIIPGRDAGGRPGGPPGSPLVSGGGEGRGGTASLEAEPATRTITNFRPPPGFMDEDAQPSSLGVIDLTSSDSEALLGRLRAQAGYWHELAKLLPVLLRMGYDAQAVELATGLERVVQSVWAISEQVYESLKKSAEMPRDKLEQLNAPGSEHLIYEMRFLAHEARPATAIYILDNNLDAAEATILSRSIKEHERRNGTKEGFSSVPADCLAYKYYRDAIEARKEKDKDAYVKKGLAAAATDSAREQLRKLVEEEIPKVASASKAVLQLVRLTRDEVGFRPVPLVGSSLAEASPADVAATVHISQIGLFNTFTPVSDGKTSFVGLPAYSILLFARRPVAIIVNDCSQVDAILESAGAKTDEAKRRLEGPGMLVVDREVDKVSELDFYLIGEGDRLSVTPGGRMPEQATLCGRVLFCARPPRLREGNEGDAVVLLP